MPIEPDTKDWTWVIERRCPECGFDSPAVVREEVASLIRANAKQWRQILGEEALVTQRPSDDRWSALEYACHVRDVFLVYDGRLQRMLTEEDPSYPNWDQDATAVESRYGEQDPRVVATELDAAASQLALRFAGVTGDQWERTGTRSDGARFTIDTFARYLVHDVAHHIHDVVPGTAMR